MKWTPRAPREGINVSPTHPLKEAATLVLGLVAVLVGLMVVVAWSVDLAVGLIPPEFETEVFESTQIDLAFEVLEDERRDDVQALLDRLVRHWPDAPYTFEVAVIPGPPNAAALPGGHVLVTKGLLDTVESENELAFVLAHELGHFHNRDHLRRLGRGVVYSLAWSVVFGSSPSLPDFATAAGDLTGRGFDRGQERDADRFALELVAEEYGHVSEAWRFFDRLTGENRALEKMAAYVSTHPASEERVEELHQLARERGWDEGGTTTPFQPTR